MKTIQKLEIAAGIATFVSTFAYFCAYMLPLAKFNYENYGAVELVTGLLWSLLMVLIPGALTATGAYLWAARASSLGFGAVMFGGSIVSILFGISHLVAPMYYSKGFLQGSLISMPLVFALLTIILAFRCRKLSSLPK